MNIRFKNTLSSIAAGVLAVSLFAGTALADDPFMTRGSSLGEAVPDEELSILRAGIDIVAVDSDTELEVLVEGNLLQNSGSINGNITISDSAMNDISGIFVSAINSGHMAVVQQSLTFIIVTEQ